MLSAILRGLKAAAPWRPSVRTSTILNARKSPTCARAFPALRRSGHIAQRLRFVQPFWRRFRRWPCSYLDYQRSLHAPDSSSDPRWILEPDRRVSEHAVPTVARSLMCSLAPGGFHFGCDNNFISTPRGGSETCPDLQSDSKTTRQMCPVAVVNRP